MTSNGPSKKLVKMPTMVISESPREDNNSITVVNLPETEEYGGVPEKPSFTSPSTTRKTGSSRDETFFDSHQWLQSDSEDDFYSVNGEFTPSCGNTPKCSFSDKLPRFHNPLFGEEKPRVSFSLPPAPRRKKLAELFRDSIREEREEILEESSENQSEESKKSSGDNSGELKVIEDSEKERKNLKSLNYHHRCLPRLSSFKGRLMEKRKKKKKIHVK